MSLENEIIDSLVRDDILEPRVIFETPFNHYHELGVTGVFGDALSRQIVERIQGVSRNASAVAAQ